MEYKFDQAYCRESFVNYLRNNFLPDDFQPQEQPVELVGKMNYTSEATLLGHSEELDLNVYEIKHNSINDARVGLSKDAFRFLAHHQVQRALVAFIPTGGIANNYRFSYVEISLSISEEGKVERSYSNPRRYSYYLGEGIATYTAHKYLLAQGRVKSIDDLQSRFSVEVLTKAFYTELSDWYAWAVKVIRFPNDLENPHDDQQYNEIGGIRLITRLIFVWFLKQMGLVPDKFFDENYIRENLIEGFNPHAVVSLFGKSDESKYYKGILQNLFFAMLNSPITEEGNKDKKQRRFSKKTYHDHSNHKLMRYEDYFKDPELFLTIANENVPFLNGGLFECLDDSETKMYIDGFSDNHDINKFVIVPDYLFFGEEVGRNIDLSEWYGDSTKKKVSARGIIDILKRYNFTVEENMPFDQEVSLDPELLGKVFENLLASVNPETKDTARRETGSFYTPREIVHFMVVESLVAYLKQSVSNELEDEFRKLLDYNDTECQLNEEQRRAVIKALFDAKILDPACGSGAFPMGMLQQIVMILNRLDADNSLWKELMIQEASDASSHAFRSENSEERNEILRDINASFDESLNRPDYARKLYVIEHCIYGSDIQPIAIQISKLRFFISLVIDQLRNNDPLDNFGIQPLPNLETKFVAANSLMKVEKNMLADERLVNLQKDLQTAYHKIFTAKTYTTKRRYRARITELRAEMVNILEEDGAFTTDMITNLTDWDMFDQNIYAPFFDPEWMLGVSGGFDLVIGNPPYIQMQRNQGELANLYNPYNYSTFERTGDIYSLFYERGWELLKPNGHLCYITSNKWMRAGYGKSTRHFFATKTNPKLLIDFAGIRIFESATVDTNILLFEKLNESRGDENTGKTLSVVTKRDDIDSISNLSDFVRQEGTICDFRTSDSWVILSPIEQSIKRKIEAVGTPLKDWNIKINYGIKTGCNEAFIISTEKRNEILEKCADDDERKRTEDLIRPILRGRDIKRYGYEWAELWLIATFPSRHYNIDEYPAVKQYLLSLGIERLEQTGKTHFINGNRVKARKRTSNKWFETQDSISYWEDFNKPKVMWKIIGCNINFCFDDGNMICNNAVNLMVGSRNNLIQFVGLMNSKLFDWYLKLTTEAEVQGGGIQLYVTTLEKTLLKLDFQQSFTEIVYQRIKNQVSDGKVDKAVFEAYGLTKEEQVFILQDRRVNRN